MAGTRRSEFDQTFGLIAKRFREDSEQVTREPLPSRWANLILHLDEQERAAQTLSQSATDPVVVEALLNELMRTEEPTAECRARLEDLRQKVARAVAERDQQ